MPEASRLSFSDSSLPAGSLAGVKAQKIGGVCLYRLIFSDRSFKIKFITRSKHGLRSSAGIQANDEDVYRLCQNVER